MLWWNNYLNLPNLHEEWIFWKHCIRNHINNNVYEKQQNQVDHNEYEREQIK